MSGTPIWISVCCVVVLGILDYYVGYCGVVVVAWDSYTVCGCCSVVVVASDSYVGQ